MHTRRGDSRCQGITDVDFTHIAITVKSEPEPNIFNLYRTIFPPDSLILFLSPVPTHPRPKGPRPQGQQAKGKGICCRLNRLFCQCQCHYMNAVASCY